MKKYLALILAFAMVFSLVACGGTKEVKKNEYVMSKNASQKSIVDGVMTDIQIDDPILKKTTASWTDTCVLYEVNVRQYTEEGTFKAFEKHLKRLKDMGINTLWFMPIHPISKTERKGTLGSYYAVDDYMAVNPEFGTMEDFQHLVDKAHKMGFKVMLDWVANHTGWDHAWIKDHPDWYDRDEEGNITFSYDWSDIAELNYDNYEMRAEMIKCMQFWVEEVGVDGFRCDHAIGVPVSFWNAATYKLRSINSDIMMLAEVTAAKNLTRYAFDSCYNDPLYNQAIALKGGAPVSALVQGAMLSTNYVEGSFPMNYLDNHDKNTYGGTIVEHFDGIYEPLLALSFTVPGSPLVYTANEQYYDHAIEFFEKDTITWEEEPMYADLIKELSQLKGDNKALYSSNPDLTFLDVSDTNVFAYSRKADDNTVVYVANLSMDKASDVTVDLGFENATCVLHFDGESFDYEDKDITAKDFEKKTYNSGEFYIFTINSK